LSQDFDIVSRKTSVSGHHQNIADHRRLTDVIFFSSDKLQ